MFKIRDDIKKDTLPVEIVEEGMYKGVIFRILSIGFTENEDQNSAVCSFDYEILDDIGLASTELRGNPKFEEVLSRVLASLINIAYENATNKMAVASKTDERGSKCGDEDRESDLKESDTQ